MILGADDGQYGLSSLNQLSITPMPLMSYWSFDPRGQVSRIRDDKTTLTKLPNHTLSISGGSQWKTYQYEAIQQYQRLIPCDFNSRSYAEIHGLPKVHILWPPHEQDIDEITFTESPQPEISLLDFTELRKELQDIGGMSSLARIVLCGPAVDVGFQQNHRRLAMTVKKQMNLKKPQSPGAHIHHLRAPQTPLMSRMRPRLFRGRSLLFISKKLTARMLMTTSSCLES